MPCTREGEIGIASGLCFRYSPPACSLSSPLYLCTVLYYTVGGNAPGELLVISVQLGVPLPHSLPARARRGTSAVPRLRIIRYFAKRLVGPGMPGPGVWSCYSIGHGAGNFEASPMFWECDIPPLCSPCRVVAGPPRGICLFALRTAWKRKPSFFLMLSTGQREGVRLLGICGFRGAVSRNIRISDEPSFRPVCQHYVS